jgi:tetratricopeptide (TPR) repeat protein
MAAYQDKLELSSAFPSALGLEPLMTSLCQAERQGRYALSARLAHRFARQLTELGSYQAAFYWLGWSLQLYRLQTTLGVDYWETLHQWINAALLLGKTDEVEEALEYHPTTDAFSGWMLHSAELELLVYQGHLTEAAELAHELWHTALQRQNLFYIAHRFVQLLLSLGREQEAREYAEQAFCLAGGLGKPQRAKALLSLGIALSSSSPQKSCQFLSAALVDLTFPWNLQAKVYLLKNLQHLDHTSKAKALLETLTLELQTLDPKGLTFFVGDTSFLQAETRLELRFFGGVSGRLNGRVQSLRPRFAEFLVVLSTQPRGLSAEQLTLAVYGENTDVACCKTELSRLRQLLPVASRPYRLEIPVQADFLELPRLLGAGQISKAVELYQGPLLPGSEAPEVCRLRGSLEEALRVATLERGTEENLWLLGSRIHDDLELWEAIATRLPQGDPRRSMARAHVSSLRRSWGLR